MKLIHLSDLHLGKRVNEISMLEDQKYILAQITEIIDQELPEVIMISGDVYDKSVPSAEAVQLFDDFLFALSKRSLQVMIISGNHDSPERLAFGNRLLDASGIHLSPVYHGEITPICLTDTFGEVRFYLLPFIKPAHVRRFYEDEGIESYTDAVRSAIKHMEIDFSCRNVLLTHQFVTGASTCESEEITVGGTDNVDASVFEGFDYVALGHIHGPQNIGGNRVRYCGTPLKYSFSESKQEKSVTIVELGEKGNLQIRTVPLIPRHDLRQLQGSFAELTDQTFYTSQSKEDYLHITLTDEDEIPEVMGRLREIYPNIMKLSYDNTRTRTSQQVSAAEDISRKNPMTLFSELYERQNNQPMTETQQQYLQNLIETVWEDNK